MRESADLVWNGESNRQLNVYRVCPCGVCSKNRKGVGYLSSSDPNGHGFTVWVENEAVFQRLRRALRHLRMDPQAPQENQPNEGAHRRLQRVGLKHCNEGLQNISPPKPDRIELLKQVRRATIEDQLHLLAWLNAKYAKVKPPEKK